MVEVDDELWDEFHRVVNMTSRELEDWLRTQAADEDWIVVLSHDRDQPIGRLVHDRDRFRYEAD